MVSLFFDEGTTALDEQQTLANVSFKDSADLEIDGTWSIDPPNRVIFTPDSPLPEDTYTASVQAHDLAGNTASVSIQFTYDTTLPETPTLDPVSSPTSFSVQTLTGTKADDSAIWINGAEVVPVDGQTTWSYQIALVEGINNIEIYAKDLAGNQSESVFASIEYDETAPLPVNTLTADGSGTGTEVALDWNGYDEAVQGDIAHYEVYVQDFLFTQVAALTPNQTVPAGTFNCIVSDLIKGSTYYFAVIAVDTKGNALSSVTPVSAVPTDTIAPEEVTGLQVQCGDTELVFSWTPSVDSAGDLAGYKAYFDGDPTGTTLASTATSHTATGLPVASEHHFKITTIDHDGNESAGISINGITLLPNPTGIVVEPFSGYADISWNAATPGPLVKHYAVYARDTDYGSVEGIAPRVITTATTAKVAGLVNNRQYFFAVTTVNLSDGERKDVTTFPATPTTDAVGPELTNATINGSALVNGAICHRGVHPAADRPGPKRHRAGRTACRRRMESDRQQWLDHLQLRSRRSFHKRWQPYPLFYRLRYAGQQHDAGIHDQCRSGASSGTGDQPTGKRPVGQHADHHGQWHCSTSVGSDCLSQRQPHRRMGGRGFPGTVFQRYKPCRG